MISPTGRGIRRDQAGDGSYGSSRGSRRHVGLDFLCDVDQAVVAPISGVIVRIANPYADSDLSGLVIRGEQATIKMFYFLPATGIVGTQVRQGQPIGTAQDVTLKYPGQGMLPHIHLQVDQVDPELLLGGVSY